MGLTIVIHCQTKIGMVLILLFLRVLLLCNNAYQYLDLAVILKRWHTACLSTVMLPGGVSLVHSHAKVLNLTPIPMYLTNIQY